MRHFNQSLLTSQLHNPCGGFGGWRPLQATLQGTLLCRLVAGACCWQLKHGACCCFLAAAVLLSDSRQRSERLWGYEFFSGCDTCLRLLHSWGVAGFAESLHASLGTPLCVCVCALHASRSSCCQTADSKEFPSVCVGGGVVTLSPHTCMQPMHAPSATVCHSVVMKPDPPLMYERESSRELSGGGFVLGCSL